MTRRLVVKLALGSTTGAGGIGAEYSTGADCTGAEYGIGAA